MKNILLFLIIASCSTRKKPPIVFQSDFGLKDGAVSAMKGVAIEVDRDLKLYDLTHEIPAYNIWEAAYRLEQTASYWPRGTVFVSVVDPGVGTERRSVVMKSRSGHYFVTPDNGTLTFVSSSLGIEEIREIDEAENRRITSYASYTFHGRDVYAYTAARLASGKISLEKIGKKLPDSVVMLPFFEARKTGDSITGIIPILDVEYGNVWTNIPDSILKSMNIKSGDQLVFSIYKEKHRIISDSILFAKTFGDVKPGELLAYQNSLMNLSFAVNQGNMADSFKISSGPGWHVSVRKLNQ